MMLEVKTRDENGDVVFEGKLNRREVGFMLQYSINDLINAGVQFHLDREDDEEEPPLRMSFPTRDDLN